MLFKIRGSPALGEPILLTGLEGWVDAGSVGSGLAAHVGEHGDVVVTFDDDALLDYRSRRPVLDIADGTMTEMTWPALTIRHARISDRDLLVLHGPEPDMRWHEFGDAIGEIAIRFGVVGSVCVGAIGAAVPHTRPTPVLATTSKRDLLDDADTLPTGLLRVPAAGINLVEMKMAELGVPSVGFWAQVPHYVAGTYHAGILAVVQRVNRHLGTSIPTDDLAERARAQRVELDAAVEGRPDAVAYLQQLESLADQSGVPSGEDIASEVERFLREASGGSGPSPFPGS